ncbi:terminase large subunit [Saccharopolyspora sp. WRP15-2]|uniref:Terminase large subunit n=1 Tax=Saccharopolyspora oryzae TaxID=2997343 RepID=A0ABT4URB6_9PSEU|nr:terminase large subunit [Saccharopolyspora oryzae]MDA3624262.1 terminase large subunit [Saccharopolyspora oryzae]
MPGVRGSQTPRVHSVPRYAHTSGDEAIELCAMAGLHLDPWQQLVLRDSLGERDDGSWAAFEVGVIVPRQNGKGSILEARELTGLFLLDEELILHSAHEFKTAQEAFRRINRLIDDTPALKRRVARVRTSHGEEGIELKDGRRLRFVARSTGSGRGFTADLVILDEAYNLPSEAMAALLPTLAARPNPQLWYTSSAGMEESTQLREIRKRGLEGDLQGRAKRLAYFEWSAQTDAKNYETALADRDEWARANPALGIRLTEDFIEAESAAMGGLEFARERLGIWYDEEADVVIRARDWQAVADSASRRSGPVVFGLDVSLNRTHGAISVCGRREDGLLHSELVDYREGTAWMVDRIGELIERHEPAAVVMDPGGPAGGLLAALQDEGIEPVLLTTREAGQACGAFFDLVVNGELRHFDQPPVNAAVAGAKKRPLGDAWVWNRKESRNDVAPLVAATLAVHGFVLYGVPDEPMTPMMAWI